MIETARCFLPKIEPSDYDLVHQLYTNSAVREYLGGPIDGAHVKARFNTMISKADSTQYWSIRLRSNQDRIGLLSIGPHHDKEQFEISYQLRPEYWNNGFASETITALLDYAKNELQIAAIVSETQTANMKSCQLMIHLKFEAINEIERFGKKQMIFRKQL